MLADSAKGGNGQMQAFISHPRRFAIGPQTVKSQDSPLSRELTTGHGGHAAQHQHCRFGSLASTI
ncbi:hypothetical protein GCM10023213_08480 [Prosthecobacter algae]|uniref:Uncharacterized protein n=1 Tax=Prosthecobacter algae TaxID=1144682 RepID=A0ABP9NVV0_9BACT